MTLLHLHHHYPLSCKESIYSQALRYNMIISEDHILLKKINNLTDILLARACPLHLAIKNIKKNPIYTCSNVLIQRTPHTETNILPFITTFSDIGKSFIATIHKNWCTIADHAMLSAIWPS